MWRGMWKIERNFLKFPLESHNNENNNIKLKWQLYIVTEYRIDDVEWTQNKKLVFPNECSIRLNQVHTILFFESEPEAVV